MARQCHCSGEFGVVPERFPAGFAYRCEQCGYEVRADYERGQWVPASWDTGDTESRVDVCEACGETRVVQAVIDPFVAEGITDDYEGSSSVWCRPCYQDRADDI